MSEPIVYDYSNPIYDEQRGQWYWEGRRADTGKRVRKYGKPQSQTSQYDVAQYPQTGYQPTSFDTTAGIEAGMQGMNLQQQPVDPYRPATYATDSSHHRRRDEGVSSVHQATPRTLPAPSGYQAHSGSTSGKTQQPPLTSAQGSANANYGVRGDTDSQSYGQATDKSVAAPLAGHQASIPQISSSGYYDEYGNFYAAAQYGQAPSDAIDDTHSRDKSRKSKHKGKGKAIAESNAYGSRDERSQYGGPSHGGGRDPRRPSGTSSDTAGFFHGQGAPYSSVSGSTISQDNPYNIGGTGDEGEDAALQDGINASRTEYGYGGTGGMSSQGGPAYQPDLGNVPTPPEDRITGTKGKHEHLDKRYRVEPSKRFTSGAVFKVMWPEPLGEPMGGGSRITEVIPLKDYKNNVWTGFRRFIVVANDDGNCTCVPILTYGNQGCLKYGVKPSKHGIVCEQGRPPMPLANEPPLGFSPIHVRMAASNEHISGPSRVNYSKLVTVEHNVKVFFIGRVVDEDLAIVQSAVNECWNAKYH
ncbi:hypothetical protein VMCG_04552 [Cytospora schulzeri]|uniref:DUF6590 domain-containing protein n=1 Tax=Cytospora schulzeri TaxID=448051 RepID=A0A423WRV9_9PEZI|nr:hypothetical protein VMCG_04552 [Valsa malicola]